MRDDTQNFDEADVGATQTKTKKQDSYWHEKPRIASSK
jgi:hypothetical protein